MDLRTRWYQSAGIRAAQPVGAMHGPGLWFEPTLQPHVSHPVVVAQQAETELLRRALARYLSGTVALELACVNHVTQSIADGSFPLAVTSAMKVTALQVYCDEGYHALWAMELCDELGASSTPGQPGFLQKLEALLIDRKDPGWVRFLFTVVTETALSSNLVTLARSEALHPAIRRFVAEHARDEARHRVLFTQYFTHCWAQLSADERADALVLLPKLVDAFLAPDAEAIRSDLAAVGLTRPEVDDVMKDSWSAHKIRAEIERGAKPTLSALAAAGAIIGAQ